MVFYRLISTVPAECKHRLWHMAGKSILKTPRAEGFYYWFKWTRPCFVVQCWHAVDSTLKNVKGKNYNSSWFRVLTLFVLTYTIRHRSSTHGCLNAKLHGMSNRKAHCTWTLGCSVLKQELTYNQTTTLCFCCNIVNYDVFLPCVSSHIFIKNRENF